MKNLYLDNLETFRFDEILLSLETIAQETQRIDFKRDKVGRPQLAHLACAFANADGGIIAIGFADPVVGEPLKLLGKVDVSDKARTALVAAMNAFVHPPLPMEIGGYVSGDQSFMVIRVERSEIAPHEYIRSDQSNLPVRRDTQIGTLRLSEIDALRARSRGAPRGSPLGQKPDARIFLQQGSTLADLSFRVRVAPAEFSQHRRVFDGENDQRLTDLVDECRGKHRTFFGNLSVHPYMDGVHLYAGEKFTWTDDSNTSQFAPEQITIDSDGEIRLRFLQNEKNPAYVQYLFALAAGYLLAQRVFYYLRLAPFADMSINWRLDDRRTKNASHYYLVPEYFGDHWNVDFATESFADSIINETILMLRSMETIVKSQELKESLEGFERENMPDLRAQWQVKRSV